MLDTSASNLYQEREAAIAYRDSRLVGLHEARARYRGGYDRSVTGDLETDSPVSGGSSPENVEFGYIAWGRSECMLDAPNVMCDSPIPNASTDVMALQVGINNWSQRMNVRQPFSEAYYDFEFAWSVLLVSQRPESALGEVAMEGGIGVPHWPYIKRIPVTMAYKDHLSTSPYAARFCGHDIIADKETLLRAARDNPDDGWIEEAIESMVEDARPDVMNRRSPSSPTRRDVMYTQMWVADAEIDWENELPDVPKEDRYQYNGRLYFLSLCRAGSGESARGEPSEIRKSIPYRGPPSGPYVFFGEHIVPDSPYMISTLMAAAGSTKLLNQTIDVVNQGICQYKRIGVIGDGASAELATILKDAQNGSLHAASGYQAGQYDTIETGGVTNQALQHTEIMMGRVDRILAIDDAQLGRADDQASATAVAVAARSASGRVKMKKDQFLDGIRRAYEIVGFHMWYGEQFAIEISLQQLYELGGQEAVDSMYNPQTDSFDEPRVYGGTKKRRSYASVSMTIEPFSADRLDEQEAARRSQVLTTIFTQLGPVLPQMPYGRADVLLKALAKYERMPEIRQLFDLRIAAEMAQSEALAEYAALIEGEDKQQLSGVAKTPQSQPAPAHAGPSVGGDNTARPQTPATGRGPAGAQRGRSSGGSAGQAAKATRS